MTDRDDASRLAAAYALGALSTAEAEEYERYVDETPDAEFDARAFEEVAAYLAGGLPEVTPSPSLRASIMDRLDSTPQLPRVSTAAHAAHPVRPVAVLPTPFAEVDEQAVSAATGTDGLAARQADQRRTPAERKAASRWFTTPFRVAAAAVVAVMLLVGGGLVGGSIAGGQGDQTGVSAQSALADLDAASDVQRTTAKVSGGGTATLVSSKSLDRSAIVASDLPSLPKGKTYQLWYLGAFGATSAGTVEAASSGATWRVLDGSLDSGSRVGVTVEPSGGSKAPTSAPIVAINI